MKVIVINMEFKEGKGTKFVMPSGGHFHFNALATLAEDNPITNVEVFMKDEEP